MLRSIFLTSIISGIDNMGSEGQVLLLVGLVAIAGAFLFQFSGQQITNDATLKTLAKAGSISIFGFCVVGIIYILSLNGAQGNVNVNKPQPPQVENENDEPITKSKPPSSYTPRTTTENVVTKPMPAPVKPKVLTAKAKYCNANIINSQATNELGLLVFENDNKLAKNYQSSVSSKLMSIGFKPKNIFKDEIILDGVAANLLFPDLSLLNELDIASMVDQLLVCSVAQNTYTNPVKSNMFTSSMDITYSLVSLSDGSTLKFNNFNIKGAGYSSENAQQNAFKKVIDRIGNELATSL